MPKSSTGAEEAYEFAHHRAASRADNSSANPVKHCYDEVFQRIAENCDQDTHLH